MGLDGVEIVVETEESFGIQIDDAEAGACVTAGDLHELVMTKVDHDQSSRCMSAFVFYRVRKAMGRPSGQRLGVSPSTSLEETFPRKERWKQWQRFSDELGLRVPQLNAPAWVFWAGLLAIVPAILWIGWWGVPLWIGMLCLSVRLFGVEGLAPIRWTVLPCETVGTLAREIRNQNFGRIAAEMGSIRLQEVWDSVRGIIHNVVGIPVETIQRRSRFIEDLQID